MAEDSGQARTEAPTPRRREEARKKGQIAHSQDLSNGLLLLTGAMILWLGGNTIADNLLGAVRSQLSGIGRTQLDAAQTMSLAHVAAGQMLKVGGVLMGILFLVGAGTGACQAGISITAQPLKPDLSRLSPISGWSRIFSMRSTVRGVMTIFKLAAISLLVWWVMKGRLSEIAVSGRGSLAAATVQTWQLAIQIALAIAAALVLLGMLDYLYQRWRHEEDLKMSRRDIKDEVKQDEGDPHVKARLKKLQREASQRKMMQDVPRATVVLTNPTHIAVALRYDRATMSAPEVVAKGTDLVARRIVKVARQNGVPVLERKPLARALYGSVEVGQQIPTVLFQAIAEILAYVYRLDRAA